MTECALTTAAAPDGPTGVGLLAGEQPGLEVLGRFGLWRRATARRCALPGTPRRSSRSRSRARCRAGPHPRLPHRPPGWHLRCPVGATAPITSSGRVSFARRCQGCPLRRRCTTAKGGRTIHLHRHEDELRAARRRAVTRSFQQSYRRWRPMVERSLAWLVADGCRPVPDRGTQRNARWWSLRVAAVNLRRLLVLGPTRQQQAWALA